MKQNLLKILRPFAYLSYLNYFLIQDGLCLIFLKFIFKKVLQEIYSKDVLKSIFFNFIFFNKLIQKK